MRDKVNVGGYMMPILQEIFQSITKGQIGNFGNIPSEVIPAIVYHHLENIVFAQDKKFWPLFELYRHLYDLQCRELKKISPVLRTIPSFCLIQGFPLNFHLSSPYPLGLRSDVDAFVHSEYLTIALNCLADLGFSALGIGGGKLIPLSEDAKSLFKSGFAYDKQTPLSTVHPFDCDIPEGFEIEESFGPICRIDGNLKVLFSIEITSSYGSTEDAELLCRAENRRDFIGVPASDEVMFVLYALVRLHHAIKKGEQRLRLMTDIVQCLASNWSALNTEKLIAAAAQRKSLAQVCGLLYCLSSISPDIKRLIERAQLPTVADDVLMGEIIRTQGLEYSGVKVAV